MTNMTNEPQSSQENDTAPAESGEARIDATERFRTGDAMQALYAQMRPDQRTAIAGEFIRLLTLAGDDHVEQFRQHFQRHTQIADDAANELLSAEQVASIDDYVRQHHSEMIAQMLEHPVTRSALKMPGVETVDKQAFPLDDEKVDKIMPTENVVTTGIGYMSGGLMMDLGGEEADKLAEDPHELSAGPGGELEREQRAFETEGEEAERPSLEPPERNA